MSCAIEYQEYLSDMHHHHLLTLAATDTSRTDRVWFTDSTIVPGCVEWQRADLVPFRPEVCAGKTPGEGEYWDRTFCLAARAHHV
jgi:hypothetical protein